MANQAAVAIENARLFKDEQRRAEQFRVIGEVGHHITSILAVDQMLDQMVRLIQEAFNYYHVGIGLVEGDEVVYKVGAGLVYDDAGFQIEPSRLKVGQEGITGWVAATGEPLLVADVGQEPRYVWMQGSQTRSELCVPLTTKGTVIGVLDVQSDRPDAFDGSDLAVLQSLAHQAAIAIENARLYEQAQQVAILEERQRLARDLHDSVTQNLYGVTMYAEAAARLLAAGESDLAAEHLRELRETSQEALREMRMLIFELRPPVLEQEGLVAALETRLEAVEERSGLEAELIVHGEGRLAADIEEGLYRIAQESLNNVLRHAHARRVTVHLCQDGDSVKLEITDDGAGFDPASALARGGLGLDGMEERAARLGGHLTLDSKPGAGTTIRVEV
jgi:signal transduction histidine kinase